MDWLIALLVLLGLAALAGLVWLHLGQTPAARVARKGGRAGSEPQAQGGGAGDLTVTLRTLRQRASHYRDIALKLEDPVAGARCWDAARLLDRAADALENPPGEEIPDHGA